MKPVANYAASMVVVPLFAGVAALLSPSPWHTPTLQSSVVHGILLSLSEFCTYGFFAALSPYDDLPVGRTLLCVELILLGCTCVAVIVSIRYLIADTSGTETLLRCASCFINAALLLALLYATHCCSGRRYWSRLRDFIAAMALVRLFFTALILGLLGPTAPCPPGNLAWQMAILCNLNSLFVASVFLSDAQRHRLAALSFVAKRKLRLLAAGNGASTAAAAAGPVERVGNSEGGGQAGPRAVLAGQEASGSQQGLRSGSGSLPSQREGQGQASAEDEQTFLRKPARDTLVYVVFAAVLYLSLRLVPPSEEGG